MKNFALLQEAIQTKNLGNIDQYATALGANKPTVDEIKAQANKGAIRKAVDFAAEKINLIPPTKDAAEQLRPQKPSAPATDREAKLKRLQELEAKEKGGQ